MKKTIDKELGIEIVDDEETNTISISAINGTHRPKPIVSKTTLGLRPNKCDSCGGGGELSRDIYSSATLCQHCWEKEKQ